MLEINVCMLPLAICPSVIIVAQIDYFYSAFINYNYSVNIVSQKYVETSMIQWLTTVHRTFTVQTVH